MASMRITLPKRGTRGLLLALLIAMAFPASAKGPKVIAGWVERIVLLPAGDDIKAKLDTGARTSSIHATDIVRFKRDGKKWVRFTLSYETTKGEKKSQTLERPIDRRIQVKEHEGENDSRPVVELPICFNGQQTSAQFSLVDRSKFIYPVLLGRRFLADRAVIDPAQSFLTQHGCGPE